MTREQLERRRAVLDQRLAELRVQHQQLLADMNAHSGAIQEVDYWLTQVALGSPPSSVPDESGEAERALRLVDAGREDAG